MRKESSSRYLGSLVNQPILITTTLLVPSIVISRDLESIHTVHLKSPPFCRMQLGAKKRQSSIFHTAVPDFASLLKVLTWCEACFLNSGSFPELAPLILDTC